MTALISPHFGEEKLESPSIEDLIDVFEDRLWHWLLKPAEALINDDFGQVAGFALLLSYFEGSRIYMLGQDSTRQSKMFFKEAFIDFFRSGGQNELLLGRIADALYEDARCGFFHDGMFRNRVYFGRRCEGPLVISLPKIEGSIDETGVIESILVNPTEFFRYVEGHFMGYVARLRDTSQTELRHRFKEACRLKWDFEGPPRGMAL